MAGAVGDVVEAVGVTAHQPQDCPHDREVVSFSLCANEIRATNLTVGEDPPHRAVVVVDVDPVTNVRTAAVELGPAPGQYVGDLSGNELLHVLIRPVVVGAVRDRRPHTVGPHAPASRQLPLSMSTGSTGCTAWTR